MPAVGTFDPDISQLSWYDPGQDPNWFDWGPYEDDFIPTSTAVGLGIPFQKPVNRQIANR